MSISTNFIRQNKIPDLNKLPVRLHQKLQKRSGVGNKAFLPIEQFYNTGCEGFRLHQSACIKINIILCKMNDSFG
jgi:hypothetical protein